MLTTRPALAALLRQNETAGLRRLSEVVHNPFQRWAVQSALQAYLHEQNEPLHFLYRLASHVDLDSTAQQSLLSEIAGRWVDTPAFFLDRLIWFLTFSLRDRRRTGLTAFAGLLADCLDEPQVKAEGFDLAAYRDIYTNLVVYPGGVEIAWSFEAMAQFLAYDCLEDLPNAVAAARSLRQTPFRDKAASITLQQDSPSRRGKVDPIPASTLRPVVLAALARLAAAGEEVAAYQAATSRVNQLAALARAAGDLKELGEEIATAMAAPERYLLLRIIRQWKALVVEASGVVGRVEERQPISNSYIAGSPVSDDWFVGRQDIVRRLEEIWAAPGPTPLVVLYGHRRMGKTSILRNLVNLPTVGAVVYLDMQDSGFVDHAGELLLDLAEGIYKAAAAAQWTVAPPSTADYHTADYHTLRSARRALNALLSQVDQIIPAGRRLIIAIDEFDILQEGIDTERIDLEVLGYLRAKNQAYPWLSLIFAGLQQRDEMRQDYKSVSYGQIEHIKVGYLPYADFLKLIYPPTLPLEYSPDLEAELYRLTYGQPFLTQHLCWELVHHWNERFLTEGDKTSRILTLADLAPLLTPDFYHSAGYYFDGVWENITLLEQMILRAMASTEDRIWSPQALAAAGDLTPEDVNRGIALLKRHDVVLEKTDGVQFASELMRRWVARFQLEEKN